MSLTYPEPLHVACPKCAADPGKRCRTLTSNRVTDSHEARWIAAAELGRNRP